MQSDTILDSFLYIRLDLNHTDKANGEFREDASKKGHLANQLLLYDQIVIPTKDFGIVPILIDWMGLGELQQALETKILGFVRTPLILGYAGNGNGIIGYEIRESEKLRFDWWQKAIFGSIEEAIELQLMYKCQSIGNTDRSALLKLILSRSKPIDWDNDLFMNAIVDESYKDIMSSEQLANFVLRHEPPGTASVKLPWLKGVNPNQLRVSSLKPIRDGIDLVLRVGEINAEVVMAQSYGKCDIGTSDGAERLIEGKLIRAGIQPSAQSKFLSLIELTQTPDIRVAISSGIVQISDVLALRKKRQSREFRTWLRNAGTHDARELEKLYVSSLESTSAFRALPTRVLRFVVTTAVGIVNPIAGPLLSVVDSFFVAKWLDGYSPKLFLDELGRLPR
jgi:hypothetical protein